MGFRRINPPQKPSAFVTHFLIGLCVIPFGIIVGMWLSDMGLFRDAGQPKSAHRVEAPAEQGDGARGD